MAKPVPSPETTAYIYTIKNILASGLGAFILHSYLKTHKVETIKFLSTFEFWQAVQKKLENENKQNHILFINAFLEITDALFFIIIGAFAGIFLYKARDMYQAFWGGAGWVSLLNVIHGRIKLGGDPYAPKATKAES